MKAALFALLLLAASCSYECGPQTCGFGCCDNGICFEGTHERNGVRCGSTPAPTTCVKAFGVCNARLQLYCCDGTYCSNEECATCRLRGSECTPSRYSTPCCPGSSCELKAGFSSQYECR